MCKIGVITNNQQGVFQRQVIEGIQGVAKREGCQVILDSLKDNPNNAITLDFQKVDGVLVIANCVSDEFLHTLYQSRKPLSLVSHLVPGLPIPVVMSNNTQGVAELVKHLVQRCRRRKFVYIRGIPTQSDAAEREYTFRQELRRYNLPMPESHFLNGEFTPEIAAQALRTLIETGADFDAVIAADYLMAAAAVKELQQAGLRVPEQVSVVGFGDAPEAEAAGITTASANIKELGSRAAAQLLSQMNQLPIRGITVLNVQLIVRQSCGCPMQPVGSGV